MARLKDDGRANLEDIAVQAVTAYEHAPVAHAVHHCSCFGRRRLTSSWITYEFHTYEETGSPYITDDRVSLRESFNTA